MMNPQLEFLCAAIDQAEKASDQPLASILARLPESQPTLSPWALWMLICLIRHHARQEWVAETIKFRLGADVERLSRAGAMGHPDVPQTGLVPGLVEWEYYFHGRGCCFTNRITGESIDVDFFDDTADWFEIYFFGLYLESL